MHAISRLPCAMQRTFLACLAVVALLGTPAHANPKYAGFVYDVNAEKVLYAENADKKRYPASLTKIMTLYIVFEELAAGRLTFSTPMGVSAYAAARPPSKIGFKPGATIEVRDAIKALVTKSANDVAVVVAEHIGGSQKAFARRMTKTARRLGMKSTTFRNPHGLPDPRQFTTARDMATLGIAIQRDFPQYYGVFQTRVFEYRNRRYGNHNKLLGRVTGVDGIKTGYIRASGFNLVTSVRRDGRHIVATVMGGRTGNSRNKHMKSLIERTLPKAKKGKPLQFLAYNDATPPPLPLSKPALAAVYVARFNAKTEEKDGDPIDAQIMAFAAGARAGAGSIMAPVASDPQTLTAVIAQASEAGVAAPSQESLPPAGVTLASLGSSRSLAPADARADAAGSAETNAGAVDDRFAVTFSAIAPAEGDKANLAALLAAIDRAAARARAASPAAAASVSPLPASATRANAGTADQAALAKGSAAARSNSSQIQLGAVASPVEANALLAAAAEMVPDVAGLKKVTVPVATTRGTLYRARFAGFQSQSEARAACKRFANQDRPCWAVSM